MEPKTNNTIITESTINVSNVAVRRLLKDIKEIIKSPLTSNGIHYVHSDSDMLNGQAMIIGPSGTPYERGYYFFDFVFPPNYPHSPPKVKYLTNDGTTRFNPNLYKCGKVCVSLLNTWHGEQWTGCQTISSVLLTLCTLLNDNPLLNEPGISRGHPECNNYNEIIKFKNFEVAIIGMLDNKSTKTIFEKLYNVMCDDFVNNYNNIIELLNDRKTENKTVTTQIYKMNVFINYAKLKENINRIYSYLHKN